MKLVLEKAVFWYILAFFIVEKVQYRNVSAKCSSKCWASEFFGTFHGQFTEAL